MRFPFAEDTQPRLHPGLNTANNADFLTFCQNNLGGISESSGGFVLPHGAVLSPDAAGVSHERLNTLTPQQRDGFLPLAPDFIVELRSETDRLKTLQEKMVKWRDNGVRLAVLLDHTTRSVHLYRPGTEPQVLSDPEILDCSPELPGFVPPVKTLFDVTL